MSNNKKFNKKSNTKGQVIKSLEDLGEVKENLPKVVKTIVNEHQNMLVLNVHLDRGTVYAATPSGENVVCTGFLDTELAEFQAGDMFTARSINLAKGGTAWNFVPGSRVPNPVPAMPANLVEELDNPIITMGWQRLGKLLLEAEAVDKDMLAKLSGQDLADACEIAGYAYIGARKVEGRLEFQLVAIPESSPEVSEETWEEEVEEMELEAVKK